MNCAHYAITINPATDDGWGGFCPTCGASWEWSAESVRKVLNEYRVRWEMEQLIERGSLGTEHAKRMRAQAPPGLGHALVRASEYLGRAEDAERRLSRLLMDLRGRNETWKRQGYTGLGINIDALLAQYVDVAAPDLGAGSTQP